MPDNAKGAPNEKRWRVDCNIEVPAETSEEALRRALGIIEKGLVGLPAGYSWGATEPKEPLADEQ